MLKIISNSNKKQETIQAKDLEPLQVAEVVEDNHYKGQIVLRSPNLARFELINLSNPGVDKCWTSENCSLKVRLLTEPITVEIKN